MTDPKIQCAVYHREGLFLEPNILIPFGSDNSDSLDRQEINLGFRGVFRPTDTLLDIMAGPSRFDSQWGLSSTIRISQQWKLPWIFRVGPTAELKAQYHDQEFRADGFLGAHVFLEPSSWLQVFGGGGKIREGWGAQVGLNLLFLPLNHDEVPSEATRRSSKTVMEHLRRDSAKADLSQYDSCHHTLRQRTAERGIHSFLLDSRAYDQAIKGAQESRVRIGEKEFLAEALGDRHHWLLVKGIQVLGNADEEKENFAGWAKSLFWGPERKFGNLAISVTPVQSTKECPAWSPPREVVNYHNESFECHLGELGNWKEHKDRDTMKFPDRLGKIESSVEAWRILPGPFQSHSIGLPSGAEKQCEWGSGMWQEMEYLNPLRIVDLDSTPGFRDKDYLCIRISEHEGPFKNQPVLQASLRKDRLAKTGKAQLIFDVDHEGQVKMKYGKGTFAKDSPLQLIFIYQ